MIGEITAQNASFDLKIGKLKRVAEIALNNGDLYSAINVYEKIIQVEPKKIQLKIRFALLIFKAKDYERALFRKL